MFITLRALPTCLCLALLVAGAVPALAAPMVVAPLCEGPRMREATDTLAIYESDHGRSTRLVPPAVTQARPCLIGLAKDRAAMLAFGRGRFEALDIDQASRAFTTLVTSFETLPAIDGDLNVLIEARAYLSWAARERKDYDTEREQLRAACVLNPGLKLDGNHFPPTVVNLAARMCRELAPSGIIDVSGVPASTRVLVDDVERCTASCVLNVPAGEHFVSVRTRDSRHDVKVDVVPRATHHVDGSPNVTVAERMRTAIADMNAWAVGQDLGEGDAIVVLLDESPRGIESWTTRWPFQTIAGPTLIIDAQHPSIGDRPRAAVDGMLAAVPAAPTAPVAQVQTQEPLYKKWWLWAGASAVVVGTVTAIAIASSSHSDNNLGVQVRVP